MSKEKPAIKCLATREEAEVWVKLGEANGLLLAADLLKTWRISKGGFAEIEYQLREMAGALGVSVRSCETVSEEPA